MKMVGVAAAAALMLGGPATAQGNPSSPLRTDRLATRTRTR